MPHIHVGGGHGLNCGFGRHLCRRLRLAPAHVKSRSREQRAEAQLSRRCAAERAALAQDLGTLLGDGAQAMAGGVFADAVLSVAAERLPVHRALLCARCDYFERLFTGGFAEVTRRRRPALPCQSAAGRPRQSRNARPACCEYR